MAAPIVDPTTLEWVGLSSAEVSDALDFVGIAGQVSGIRAVVGEASMIGRAATVRYVPAVGGSVGDFIDDVPPGAVVAVDNSGRLDCTVWGGILSEVAVRRGIAGAAINGACRDTATAEEAGFPLFARINYMRTGKDRVRLEATNETVSFGDVPIHPGDIIVGDRDGLVVVPSAAESEVLDRAHRIREAEERIVALVRAGESLVAARAAEGYHLLQRAER